LAGLYKTFFDSMGVRFFTEPENSYSNYWLNAVILEDRKERDEFLTYTNDHKVMTRPIWKLMNKLEMFQNCQCNSLEHAEWLEDRVVNIPSSIRIK
ncbi:MAG: DegT/DnrJ/EryC1/StrS family aminotransferase, partial [Salinivirgaceae bacterium]|nr:DegT/DnrJ/EryC1/StrS family aminotransferase [Salinivirgaceae bacterium]